MNFGKLKTDLDYRGSNLITFIFKLGLAIYKNDGFALTGFDVDAIYPITHVRIVAQNSLDIC